MVEGTLFIAAVDGGLIACVAASMGVGARAAGLLGLISGICLGMVAMTVLSRLRRLYPPPG